LHAPGPPSSLSLQTGLTSAVLQLQLPPFRCVYALQGFGNAPSYRIALAKLSMKLDKDDKAP